MQKEPMEKGYQIEKPKGGKLSSEVNKKEMQTAQFSQEILELLKSSAILRTKKGSEYREDRILLQGCYRKKIFFGHTTWHVKS